MLAATVNNYIMSPNYKISHKLNVKAHKRGLTWSVLREKTLRIG
jgi:hypothetical protein